MGRVGVGGYLGDCGRVKVDNISRFYVEPEALENKDIYRQLGLGYCGT